MAKKRRTQKPQKVSKGFDLNKYIHSHIYYIVAVIAFTMFMFSAVQGIILHTRIGKFGFDVTGVFLIYLMAVMFLTIALRAWSRARRHYKYEY